MAAQQDKCIYFQQIRYERGNSHTVAATFVGGARTLAQHQSARFIFLIGPNGVQSSRANSRRFLAVRAHYPITRIKLAVGPTANKSCIVYGGLYSNPIVNKFANIALRCARSSMGANVAFWR